MHETLSEKKMVIMMMMTVVVRKKHFTSACDIVLHEYFVVHCKRTNSDLLKIETFSDSLLLTANPVEKAKKNQKKFHVFSDAYISYFVIRQVRCQNVFITSHSLCRFCLYYTVSVKKIYKNSTRKNFGLSKKSPINCKYCRL